MTHRRTEIVLPATGPFRFADTARSHGWVSLAPNRWDEEEEVMHRAHRLASGRTAWLVASEAEGGSSVAVEVFHRGELGPADEARVRRDVARMFRLEEDLSGFHRLCRRRGGPWAEVPEGLGRLLRSPTVFEDVVKTICTTNVRWGGTERMVRELVEAFGEPVPPAPSSPAGHAFPTPDAVAAASPEALGRRVGLGYRAPYVHGLARRVASGELDLEGLADADLATPELKEELLRIKGVGPYAASTLLMLLGRYDELAVDSVFRSFVAETHFGGESVPDDEARAVYEGWGRWKFLAYWFELWASSEPGA